MRALLALLLATTAIPALADTLLATSRITAVTVYPEGARVTREVTFAAPSSGVHELLVTDLPAETSPAYLQLVAGNGLQLGAFNLRADRLPPRADPLTPDQTAAKTEVERLEAAESTAYLAIEAVQAEVDAADAQARFLSSFTGALPQGATPEMIKSMAAMIGAESLAARQAALAARARLWPTQKALAATQETLARARAAYAALPSADMEFTALSVAVTAAAPGDQNVTITQYISGASWRPFYDLKLTREGDDALAVDRSVLVTQYTGEDWTNVALTLSSSAPADQAAPSMLWPDLRQITPEVDMTFKAAADDGATYYEEDTEVVAEAAPAPITAGAALEGDTVVYVYPTPVTIASDVEDLRLALDSLSVASVADIVIDLADARVLRGVLGGMPLQATQLQDIVQALADKDASTLQAVTAGLPDVTRRALAALLRLYGGDDVLDAARSQLPEVPLVQAALGQLQWLASHLRAAYPSLRVGFDLSDMSGYAYYSGARYAIYGAGCSDALARGGRYDEVGAVFGRNRPAVGFSLDLKSLAEVAGASQAPAAVRAPWGEDTLLRAAVRRLRAAGETVVAVLPGHEPVADAFACDRELVNVGGQWVVRALAVGAAD